MNAYPSNKDKELIKAITALETEKQTAALLRDLLTPNEIEEFSGRFQIAKLLWTTALPYKNIAEKVGTSTTTVTRVAHWLFKESWGGYRTAFQKKYGNSSR